MLENGLLSASTSSDLSHADAMASAISGTMLGYGEQPVASTGTVQVPLPVIFTPRNSRIDSPIGMGGGGHLGPGGKKTVCFAGTTRRRREFTDGVSQRGIHIPRTSVSLSRLAPARKRILTPSAGRFLLSIKGMRKELWKSSSVGCVTERCSSPRIRRILTILNFPGTRW